MEIKLRNPFDGGAPWKVAAFTEERRQENEKQTRCGKFFQGTFWKDQTKKRKGGLSLNQVGFLHPFPQDCRTVSFLIDLRIDFFRSFDFNRKFRRLQKTLGEDPQFGGG